MTTEQFLEILRVAGKLKLTYRHCETESGRRESVAEHSWRAALMAFLLKGEADFDGIDMMKVVKMALIHDLGEAFTGDTPSFYKTSGASANELTVFQNWLSSFPEPQRKEWSDLLDEMVSCQTAEAHIFKALDKLEAVLSHDESDINSWSSLERFLQLTYGLKESACSDYLASFKKMLDDWTRRKIIEDNKRRGLLNDISTTYPKPDSEYVFRLCEKEEVESVFQLILDRMKWMDEVGLKHWNAYEYDKLFPLTYYETAQERKQLFVLEKVCDHRIVSAGVLLEEDSRWNNSDLSLYIHNLASDASEKGTGALFILFVEDRAKSLGKKYLRLDVLNNSPKLFQYYERLGFVYCGTCVDGWYSGVLFQKDAS